MGQHFCDFVPQSDGWAVLMDGRWTASYPSLQLAVNAVAAERERKGAAGSRLVMRRLDADGNLRQLAAVRQGSAARDLQTPSV
ncbi:hypothetical protein DFR52_101247 [Hoeflea marina]|uniref:DUF2188 family protein n=1 Tax=Hoeflea marina TaxID=274592 RepID=A0A317PTL0_9HYPH|nr:hypothetical protein [Hoeflea marina]PWW03566.1 hypothetical protein DFR52_101247 [Hoeflea marina]